MVIADIDYEEYFTKAKLAELRAVFERVDVKGTGSIGPNELYQVFAKNLGIKLNRQQIAEVIAGVDHDCSGTIEFEEFCVLLIKLQGQRPRADLISYKEYLNDAQIKKLEAIFGHYDKSGDGTLDASEMIQIFQDCGMALRPEQISEIVQEVDADGSGEIEFDEFCAMWAIVNKMRKRINPREFIDSARLAQYYRAFRHFDVNGNGVISQRELDGLFRVLGVALKREQLDALMRQFDTDCSGLIEFDEFCVMMVQLKGEKRKRRLVKGQCDFKELRKEGLSVKELKQAGFDLSDFRKNGVSAAEILREGSASALDLRRAGFLPAELRKSGLGAHELRYCGFSLMDLRNAGYSAAVLEQVNRKIHKSFTVDDLSLLPQKHPQHSLMLPANSLPQHTTPRIRHHTDWRPKVAGEESRKDFRVAGAAVIASHRLRSKHPPHRSSVGSIATSCLVHEPSLQVPR